MASTEEKYARLNSNNKIDNSSQQTLFWPLDIADKQDNPRICCTF